MTTKTRVTLPAGAPQDGPLTVTRPGLETVTVKVTGGKITTDEDGARLLALAYPGAIIDAPTIPPAGAGDTAGDAGTSA